MILYPQDEGTGVSSSESDYVDAALVGQLAHTPYVTDLVVEGFSLSPDYSTPSVTIERGVARVSEPETTTPDHSGDGGPKPLTVRNVTYTVQTDSNKTISLTTDTVNEIYLVATPSTSDGISFEAVTNGSSPSDPSLKLGEIDTAAQTKIETNRYPDITAASLTSKGNITAGSVDSEGQITENGNPVLTTVDDISSLTVENIDGTPVVTEASALQAGNKLSFSDDGDGTATLEVTQGSEKVAADTALKSGDGSTTSFSLSHSLGMTPSVASVTPTSQDAASDFWVSSKTSSAVEISYSTAPASGSSNLGYDIITRGSQSGTIAISKSGDGSTRKFSLSHMLDETPEVAHATATSSEASTDFWISGKNSSAVEITYAAAPPSGNNNLTFNLLALPSDAAGTTTETKSGDDSTTTFTLSHPLGSTPEVAYVSPSTEDASTDFWISNKTSTTIDITYAAAPPSGTENLGYDILVKESGAPGTDTAVLSGDGSTSTFTLSHSLGDTPTGAYVLPASEDASTDFWISGLSSSSVKITYAAAPPSGTDNLAYDIISD